MLIWGLSSVYSRSSCREPPTCILLARAVIVNRVVETRARRHRFTFLLYTPTVQYITQLAQMATYGAICLANIFPRPTSYTTAHSGSNISPPRPHSRLVLYPYLRPARPNVLTLEHRKTIGVAKSDRISNGRMIEMGSRLF